MADQYRYYFCANLPVCTTFVIHLVSDYNLQFPAGGFQIIILIFTIIWGNNAIGLKFTLILANQEKSMPPNKSPYRKPCKD